MRIKENLIAKICTNFLLSFSAAFSVLSCALAETPSTGIVIQLGAGRLIELKSQVRNVFAADPKIAEVRPANSSTLFVFGTGVGHTTISASDETGHSIAQYDVTVVPAQYPASQTRESSSKELGNSVTPKMLPGGMILNGYARDPEQAQKIAEEAQDEVGKDHIYNHMTGSQSLQVNLQVKVVEMSRQLVREIGVNWENMNALGTSAAIGIATQNPLAAMTSYQNSLSFLSKFKVAGRSMNLETVIDALSQDQLIHVLAEPNLTTMSGESASFLVGGEYPIPVSSYNNTVSVQFKQYGVSLSFVPTVLTSGRINLHVRPEVSQLSTNGAVQMGEGNSTISIPALTVSRADTTVELGSGQSFAIAGLFQDNTTNQNLGLPGLGDLPILGALFRSNSFQHNQSELVIIITPYVVRPVGSPDLLKTPDFGWAPPSDYQRIFQAKQRASDREIYDASTDRKDDNIDGKLNIGFMVN